MVGIPGFKKKKAAGADSPNAEGAEELSERDQKVAALKENERLGSVLSESVPGSAIEAIAANTPFLVDGGRSGIVLVLDVLDIGGLSAKHNNDANKGGIATQMGINRIRAVASAEMLADQKVAIVPTQESLDMMREYSLLVKAPYAWGKADLTITDEIIIRPGGETSFGDALKVASGALSIESVLSGDKGSEPATETIAAVSESSQSEQEGEGSTASNPDVLSVGSTGGAQGSPASADPEDAEESVSGPAGATDEDPLGTNEEVPEGYIPDEEDLSDEIPGDEEDEDLSNEEPFDPDSDEDEPWEQDATAFVEDDDDEEEWTSSEEVIDGDAVHESIARRFTSEDLELLVELDPFDQQFSADTPPIRFYIETDVSDWLGQQVAVLQEQANVSLEEFHLSRVAALRQTYVGLCSVHADRVLQQVDVNNSETRFGRLLENAKQRHALATEGRDAKINERQVALRKAFEQRMEEAAEAAAARERAIYRERHGATLENDLALVPSKIEQEQARIYDDERRRSLELREQQATMHMEQGVTRILNSLAEQYDRDIEDGLALREKWQQRISDFLDQHRKEDVDRVAVLKEKLDRDDEVSRVREEAARERASYQHEAEVKLQALSSELERTRKSSAAHLASREAELEGLLTSERQRTDAERERAAQAEETAVEKAKDRFQTRVSELEATNQGLRDDLDRTESSAARQSKILIVLVVILALLGAMVGLIVGLLWGGNIGGETEAAAASISYLSHAGGSGVS